MSFLSFLQDSLIPANLYVIEINPIYICSKRSYIVAWYTSSIRYEYAMYGFNHSCAVSIITQVHGIIQYCNIYYTLKKITFSIISKITITIDHSPIRQTFELGKFISTAGKSINLVKLWRLVEKYRKMWKIQSCEVCEFCILLYYVRKSVTTFRNVKYVRGSLKMF